MAGFSRIVRFDEVRSVAFGALTAGFLPLGTPFSHIMRLMKFINNTDQAVQVSFNQTTLNDVIPAGGFSLYDFTSNSASEGAFVMQINTQIYVRSLVAPTSGDFYVITIYGQGE